MVRHSRTMSSRQENEKEREKDPHEGNRFFLHTVMFHSTIICHKWRHNEKERIRSYGEYIEKHQKDGDESKPTTRTTITILHISNISQGEVSSSSSSSSDVNK